MNSRALKLMVNLENLASYLLLQYSIYAVSDTAAYRNKQIDEHLESTFSGAEITKDL